MDFDEKHERQKRKWVIKHLRKQQHQPRGGRCGRTGHAHPQCTAVVILVDAGKLPPHYHYTDYSRVLTSTALASLPPQNRVIEQRQRQQQQQWQQQQLEQPLDKQQQLLKQRWLDLKQQQLDMQQQLLEYSSNDGSTWSSSGYSSAGSSSSSRRHETRLSKLSTSSTGHFNRGPKAKCVICGNSCNVPSGEQAELGTLSRVTMR